MQRVVWTIRTAVIITCLVSIVVLYNEDVFDKGLPGDQRSNQLGAYDGNSQSKHLRKLGDGGLWTTNYLTGFLGNLDKITTDKSLTQYAKDFIDGKVRAATLPEIPPDELNEMREKYDKYIMKHLVHFRWHPVAIHLFIKNQTTINSELLWKYPYVSDLYDLSLIFSSVYSKTSSFLDLHSDNVILKNVLQSGKSVQTVLLAPQNSRKLSDLMALPSLNDGERRSLSMGGLDDPHLSVIYSQFQKLYDKKKFSVFYIEGKDIRSPFVKALPMGFILAYLIDLSLDKVVDYVKSTNYMINKQELICTSWGAKWEVEGRVPDRFNLQIFVNNLEESFAKMNKSSWLQRQFFASEDYLDATRRFVFFAMPAGNGVQSPKLYESLLVGTIPIVTRNPTNEDLLSYGYPIIMIDHWDNLTHANVIKWETEVRFPNGSYRFNWDSVRYMLTTNYSMELVRGERDVLDAETQARVDLFRSFTSDVHK